jgi:hypothetical protein
MARSVDAGMSAFTENTARSMESADASPPGGGAHHSSRIQNCLTPIFEQLRIRDSAPRLVVVFPFLNETQRAMVAAKIATLKQGDNQHTPIGETSARSHR